MLRTPAPARVFENFGDSALMFNLRVSLPDIAKAGGVQSDLRIAIFKALRAANIEIPFNQLDVNLRDLEASSATSGSSQERAGKSARQPTQRSRAGNGNGPSTRRVNRAACGPSAKASVD